jgi:hypothetical protein
MMRRTLLILAAAALVVVLLAASASTAFAAQGDGWGQQCGGPKSQQNEKIGNPETTNDNCGHQEGQTEVDKPNGFCGPYFRYAYGCKNA